jgi:hypothetical protein
VQQNKENERGRIGSLERAEITICKHLKSETTAEGDRTTEADDDAQRQLN